MDELTYKCPLLKHDCIGNKCMWWVDTALIIKECIPAVKNNKKCAITRLAMRPQ